MGAGLRKRFPEVVKYYYKVGRKLGEGGFGTVYECYCKCHDDSYKFALKKVKHTSRARALEAGHLEEDIHLLLGDQHGRIMQHTSTFIVKNIVYTVIEFIDGRDLFNHLARMNHYYNELYAISFMHQIMSGVEYIHSKGIIHRDLNPHNIMMRKADWTVKIIDFGLAVMAVDDGSTFLGMAGTPEYMAPEIFERQPYGREVDIWSCAIIFYNMLSGRHPFKTEPRNMIYRRIARRDFPFTSDVFPSITERSVALAKRMITECHCEHCELTPEAIKNKLEENFYLCKAEGLYRNQTEIANRLKNFGKAVYYETDYDS